MRTAIITNQNQRGENQDTAMLLQLPGAVLAAVFDGMGGLTHGGEAAHTAAHALREIYTPGCLSRGSPDVIAALDAAVATLRIEKGSELGSTVCVAELLDNRRVCIRWLGDSRAYLFRSRPGIKQVHLLTTDDNYVCEQYLDYRITVEQLRVSPDARLLTAYLGRFKREGENPFRCRQLQRGEDMDNGFLPGDLLLLCTDGAIGSIDEDTLAELIYVYQNDPEKLIREICRDAREKYASTDNQTVVCLIFGDDPREDSQEERWDMLQRAKRRRTAEQIRNEGA